MEKLCGSATEFAAYWSLKKNQTSLNIQGFQLAFSGSKDIFSLAHESEEFKEYKIIIKDIIKKKTFSKIHFVSIIRRK